MNRTKQSRLQQRASPTRARRSLPEGRREEALDLLLVHRLAAGRDGARGLAARVERVLALVVLRLVRGGEDAGRDIAPCTVVERLLLAPENVRVGVLVKVRRDLRVIISTASTIWSYLGVLTRS